MESEISPASPVSQPLHLGVHAAKVLVGLL